MKDQLQGFVLAQLFSNSLIDTGEEINAEPAKKNLRKGGFNYLGNYENNIIVLVNDKENIFLDDESLNFLSGILNACKLNLAHIAIINLNNSALNFLQLKKEMQPQFLLLFGITALQIELPFAMPDYQVQQYNNCAIVTAPALNILNKQTQEAKTEKTRLWKSLQKMFDLV